MVSLGVDRQLSWRTPVAKLQQVYADSIVEEPSHATKDTHTCFQVSTYSWVITAQATPEPIGSPCTIEIERIWTLDLDEPEDISIELERLGQARAHPADVVDLSQGEGCFFPSSYLSEIFQPIPRFEHFLGAPFAPALSLRSGASPSIPVPVLLPSLRPTFWLVCRCWFQLPSSTRTRAFRRHRANGHHRSGSIQLLIRSLIGDPSGSNPASFGFEPGRPRTNRSMDDVSET